MWRALVFSLVLQHHGVKVCSCCCILQEWCHEKVAALNWPLQPRKIQQNRAFAKYRKIPMVLSFIIYHTIYVHRVFPQVKYRKCKPESLPWRSDNWTNELIWMGMENLYSGLKDHALFGYPTYLCFLLLGSKSSLENVGGWGEAQVFSISSVRFHLSDPISPYVKWGHL